MALSHGSFGTFGEAVSESDDAAEILGKLSEVKPPAILQEEQEETEEQEHW